MTAVLRRVTTVLLTLAVAMGSGTAAWAAVTGPDVSSWNHPKGAAIDWTAVKGAGHSFAFIKATEDTWYTNPYFADDWKQAGAVGLYRSAYHYARPATPVADSAVAQARYFVSAAGTQQGKADLPPVLDFEESGGLSATDLVAWAKAWLTEVQRLTGRKPIIYTYVNFWKNTMGNTTALSDYPLWLAHYTTNGQPPTMVGGWQTYTFWQYTATGTSPGIQGGVDLNRFCCAVTNLAAMAGSTDQSASNPFGYFDNLIAVPATQGGTNADGTVTQPTPPGIRVRGWAIDPDTTDPVNVTLSLDGAPLGSYAADTDSPDVAQAYPGFGPAHRYDVTVPVVDGGSHTVCVVVPNVGYGTGPTNLGCKDVTLPATPPAAPGLPTATFVGPQAVEVGWTPPTRDNGAPVTEYAVTATPQSNQTQQANTASPRLAPVTMQVPATAGSAPVTTLTGLEPGMTYQVSVVAANTEGPGPSSTPVAVTPQPAGSIATVCSGSDPQPFTDLGDDAHAAAIACMAARHVLSGKTADTYDPHTPVTREQMATLLVNALRAAGVNVAAATSTFTDIPDGDVHAGDIGALAQLGVAKGHTPTEFDPAGRVTREQMATFLNRAYVVAAGSPLPAGPAGVFTDIPDGDGHTADIEAVAAAGISLGHTATTFQPGVAVPRDQLASFLARTLNLVAQVKPLPAP